MSRAWILAPAALALAGCVATGQQLLADGTKALAEAPVCCASLATARLAPLPLQPVDVVIDHSAQAFNFGGNKAFFVLYQLPRFEQTYSIVLSSLAGGTLQDVALLVPRVATYDADFRLVRYFDEKTLRNRGNNLERTVFINESDRAERYIAIYGSDLSASIERAYSMATVTPVFAGPYMFYVHSGTDGKSMLRSSPAGKLRLEVQGLSK